MIDFLCDDEVTPYYFYIFFINAKKRYCV